jgi:hypothetical protein
MIVANPHRNARAELGVKTVKRMLMDIVSAKGILDRAVVSRALLQLRNTPDRDNKLSQPMLSLGESSGMGDMWMNLVDARETAGQNIQRRLV